MREATSSRGRVRPASSIPSTAASIAARFIFMKSVSVLSRSKMMARIMVGTPSLPRLGLLAGRTDGAAETDFAVVDANVETAGGIGANPGFVGDRSAVPAVVRKWDEHSRRALSALRKLHFHVPDPPLHTIRRQAPPAPPTYRYSRSR